MDRDEASSALVVLETERLLLTTWLTGDAVMHRRLWAERDPRVPAHRRLSRDGHPTVTELEVWSRRHERTPDPGLLVVRLKTAGTDLGYCGLVENSVGRPEEPELAFELLRAFWNRGYATEAAGAVVDLARSLGHQHLASTVRAWNTASLRVLEKLGFVNTGECEADEVHGDSLLLRKSL